MKSYQNIEQLKKEWATYGVKVNEKGELVTHHEGKDYVIGHASFFAENGEPVTQEKSKKLKKNSNSYKKRHLNT